ncbi:MAG: Hpt domain-containing protein [Pseudobdellovibrionaceae bacterium]|nr:Hpt domain-containing protein [Pseudobdellovibrionaceae bacterium]
MSALEASLIEGGNGELILRQSHGWKGSARTLGLKPLATALHQMESCFDTRRGSSHTAYERLQLWQKLKAIRHEYEEVFHSMTIKRGGEEHRPSNLYAYSAVYARELREALQAEGIACRGLVIADEVHDCNLENLATLHEALIHAVNNAVGSWLCASVR